MTNTLKLRQVISMRYRPGTISSETETKLYIDRIPNWIAWLSNIYDWADYWLTGCSLCNTRFRAWLYKVEDRRKARFSIPLDRQQKQMFYIYMKWQFDEDD